MPSVPVIGFYQPCSSCGKFIEMGKVNYCKICNRPTCIKCGYRSRILGVYCPRCAAALTPTQQEILRYKTQKWERMRKLSLLIIGVSTVFFLVICVNALWPNMGWFFGLSFGVLVLGGILHKKSTEIQNAKTEALPNF